MKVFLLAAGEGTRLRPLTCKVPKCMAISLRNSFWISTLGGIMKKPRKNGKERNSKK